MFQNVNETLRQLNTEVTNIRKWRNKRLAHLDRDTNLNYSSSQVGRVVRGDIDHAIALISEIFNSIATYYGLSAREYEREIPGDGDTIVRLLEIAMKKI